MFIFLFNVISLSIVLLISILTIKDFVYESREKKINKCIPGPKGVPVFGNLLQIDSNDLPTSIENLYKIYGSIFRLRLGNSEVLFLSGSDVLDQVFIKNRRSYERLIRLSRFFLLNKDIMYSNGELNHHLRNVIMSEVTATKINNNNINANKYAIELINKIYSSNQDIVMNVPFYFKEYGIKILLNFIYGTEENDQVNKRLIQTVATLFKTGGQFIYSDYSSLLLPIDLYKMSKSNLISDYLYIRDYSNEIIKRYEQRLNDNNNDESIPIDNNNKTLIQLYYDKYLKGEIQYESIAYAAVDLLVAGLDSTTNTLSFCIAALINNPDIQERLYQEIINNNTQEETLSYSNISKYPYTIQVMNEAYRYYAIVPISEPLIATQDIDIQINNTKYTIAKNTHLYKNLRSTHLSDEYWGNESLKFNPDRFKSSSTLNDKSLYHFGNGTRICVGKKFAECVFFTSLVLLVKNYKFVNPTNKPIDDTGIVALAMQCKEFDAILIKREQNT